MIHHDRHHIWSYVIFFLLSVLLIGSLAYYFAPNSFSGMRSSALDGFEGQNTPTMSSEVTISEPAENTLNPEETSEKRMRFTKLLLKYQAELQALEAQKMDSLGEPADPEVDQKIMSLTNRIENLQNIINSLSGEDSSVE